MRSTATPLSRKGLLANWRFSRRQIFPYLLLVPSLALILLIQFYPFTTGVLYSLQKGSLLKLQGYVGLDNYQQALNMPDFWHAVVFSALFAVCNIAGSYLIGLGLSLLLNQDFPFRRIMRVALL